MKNLVLLLSITFGLLTFQSCIKKKEPVSTQAQSAADNKAAAKKLTPAQLAKRKAARNQAARKNKSAKRKTAGKTAGKVPGYWPSLRQHLGIDVETMLKLRRNEASRVADLTKPNADAKAVGSKYDQIAKGILGPNQFAKMQSFKMK